MNQIKEFFKKIFLPKTNNPNNDKISFSFRNIKIFTYLIVFLISLLIFLGFKDVLAVSNKYINTLIFILCISFTTLVIGKTLINIIITIIKKKYYN